MSVPASFDARELFAVLARHEVDYVTIGGIAVQAHGGQRATQDLDIAIATATDNRARLAAALADLDARILGPDGKRSTAPPSASMLATSGISSPSTDSSTSSPSRLTSDRSTNCALAPTTSR